MSSYVIPVFPAASRVPPRDALAARLAELTGRFAELSSELAAISSAVASVSGKADKAVPLAAGNLASLDASGNLLDSGATPASIKAAAVAEVVANAPGTMDTLKEIADILGSSQQSGTVLKRISDLETGKADGDELDGKRGLADMSVYEPASAWDGTDGAQTYRFTLKSESSEAVLWATGDDPSTAVRLTWWADDGGYWTLDVPEVEAHGEVQQPRDARELEFEVSGATWTLARGVERTADSLARESQVPAKTSDLTNDGDGTHAFVKTNDTRLSDARAPTAHHATHSTGGSDAIAPADIGAAAATDLHYRLVEPGKWEFSGSGVQDGVEYEVDLGISGETACLSRKGEAVILDETEVSGDDVLSIAFPNASITATRASLPGHLLDRAGNRVVVTGDTTLTLPAANPGYLRDFLVRLEISGSTVPTITFAAPTGETITYETDGDEFPVPDEAGNWLYSFTETVAHKFAVSLKKVNEVAQGGS